MTKVNPEFIERFQLEYEKNPRSRVFAALAEAYRKMGLVEEANRICSKGVQIHPNFAGGRVAYAKVLLDLKKPEQALEQLEKAIAVSPENLLAHTLMGEVLLQLRRPKDALKSFKMVLFLNPNDEKAKQAVAKWEFLSADEYEDELFAMKPVFAMEKTSPGYQPPPESDAPVLQPITSDEKRQRALERAISLADAFTVRGEPEKALAVLSEARIQVGTNREIEKRYELLAKKTQSFDDVDDDDDENGDDLVEGSLRKPSVSPNYGVDPKERIRQKLETFLRRIEARRMGG